MACLLEPQLNLSDGQQPSGRHSKAQWPFDSFKLLVGFVMLTWAPGCVSYSRPITATASPASGPV